MSNDVVEVFTQYVVSNSNNMPHPDMRARSLRDWFQHAQSTIRIVMRDGGFEQSMYGTLLSTAMRAFEQHLPAAIRTAVQRVAC